MEYGDDAICSNFEEEKPPGSERASGMSESLERIKNKASSTGHEAMKNIQESAPSIPGMKGQKETDHDKAPQPNPDEIDRIDRMDKERLSEYLQEKHKSNTHPPSTE